MKDSKKLLNLAREIKRCKKCRLWKTRKNTVPGEGPINAKILFIGQAPGNEEDKIGRPFIGRAGKLLTELLDSANINRQEVFITSILKCFPPKNRKPKKDEIEACSPYLKKQIEIINPKLIVLLGEVAKNTLIGLNRNLKDLRGKNLKDLHGKIVKKYGRTFFVTYHPAAGIRFQKFKRKLFSDFKKLKRLVRI